MSHWSLGTPTVYNGVTMRSKTEAAWAKYFDNNGIDWIYEPTTFKVGSRKYTPDFSLMGGSVFFEVKSNMPLGYNDYSMCGDTPLIVAFGYPEKPSTYLMNVDDNGGLDSYYVDALGLIESYRNAPPAQPSPQGGAARED